MTTSNDNNNDSNDRPVARNDAATMMRQAKENVNNCDHDTGARVGGSNPNRNAGRRSDNATCKKNETTQNNDKSDLGWKLVQEKEVEVTNPADAADELADKITNCVSFSKSGCNLEASAGPLVGPTHMTLHEMLELDQQDYGVDARDMLQTYLEEMKDSQAICSVESSAKLADLQQYFNMVSSSMALSKSGTSTRQGKTRRREKYHRLQHAAVLQERRARDAQRGLRNVSPDTASERKERRERLEEERYMRLSQIEVKARRNRKQGWVSGLSLGTSLAALVTEQSLASRDTLMAGNQLTTSSRTQTRQ